METDLFVDLPTLSATPVIICRHLVLQQALEAVGLSMHETTTRYDEENEASIITIDDIHSAELKRCQRELLQASSWAEAFQSHAANLRSQLAAMGKHVQTKPTKERVDAQLEHPPNTSAATFGPPGASNKEDLDMSLCLTTPDKLEGVSSRANIQSVHKPARKALFLLARQGTNLRIQALTPSQAVASRKKRRVLIRAARCEPASSAPPASGHVLDDLVPFVRSGGDQRQPNQLPSDILHEVALSGKGSTVESLVPPDIRSCNTWAAKESTAASDKQRSPQAPEISERVPPAL